MDPQAEGEFRQQAEDLLQGALAKAALRWRRIRSDPEANVRRILYRDQVSRWRLRSWGRETPAAAVPERADARDPVGDADLRLSLAGALRRLPPRQRAVLVLRFYEDLDERQAAELLEVSVGTIRSATWRGLARLRTLCAGLELTPEAPR